MKTEALVVDSTIARRYDVPTGAVPEYQEFLRRVWSWQDENGRSCVSGPPWMYTIVIHDMSEVLLVSSILAMMERTAGFVDRFKAVEVEDGSQFSFADLASLHLFLRSCAAIGATNETARRVCEYVMWTLGFRWV